MITLLQVNISNIVDVVFGISFIISGLVTTGYILRLFYYKKV